jgi:hypothetical protein
MGEGDKQSVRQLISKAFDVFYDPKMIPSEEEAQQQAAQHLLQSFAPNQNDDVDKIKYYWAYFLPCALALNDKQTFWLSKGRATFNKLYKDVLLNVRRSLSASLFEVMKLVDMSSLENQKYFMEVVKSFMQDIEEVRAKVTPNLCKIVNMY